MTSTQSFRESMVLEHLHNPNYICRVAAVSVSVGDSREEESPSSCLPHNDYLWHFVWKVSHPAHLLFHGDWWSWKAWEQGEKLFISFYIKVVDTDEVFCGPLDQGPWYCCARLVCHYWALQSLIHISRLVPVKSAYLAIDSRSWCNTQFHTRWLQTFLWCSSGM